MLGLYTKSPFDGEVEPRLTTSQRYELNFDNSKFRPDFFVVSRLTYINLNSKSVL